MAGPIDPHRPPFGDDNIALGPGFFYRPRELLVDAADVRLVKPALPRGTERLPVPRNLTGTVVRYLVPENVEVLDLVARLRATPVERRLRLRRRGTRPAQPRVGPHFIMLPAQADP